MEAGGEEDQVIAALLHDAAEDHGGRERLEEIRRKFGDRVANIVEGCSDDLDHLDAPWRQRKERYIQHLREAPEEVLLVSLADKLHNARSVLMESRQLGEAVFERFQGGRDYSAWYEPALLEVFSSRMNGPLVEEFGDIVRRLDSLARETAPP
jgi:(p)ppGpp synthase/HD superfamily hydrolase